MFEAIIIVLAYLLGSIPTAVWYGRVFHKVDIRQYGSGNAGATNSLRILGKKAGVIVLIIDLFKGILAVTIARIILPENETAVLIAGFMAVMGHLFPVFAQFKGGKGVATSLGVVLAVYPLGALVCIGSFILVVFLTRIVSLGSLFGALAFLVAILFMQPTNYALQIFAGAIFVLLTITHRQNAKRLFNGTESKIGQKKEKEPVEAKEAV